MGENVRSHETGTVFWELLDPLKHILYNFLRKSLNFYVQADDVYQETVLHAFQYFDTFKTDKNFKAWIFAIAHNEIKKHLKKTRQDAAAARLNLPAVSGPDERRALIREIFEFAARLKPREREVFFLFYENGFSVSEIRTITGLKDGYVKLLLHQARTQLKTALGVNDEE